MLDLVDLVALSQLTATERRRVRQAVFAWRPAGGSAATLSAPPLGLLIEQIAGTSGAERTMQRLRDGAARHLEAARRLAIEPVGWGDARYPRLLSAIGDPPPVLWVRGDLACLNDPAVAVVGSRAATPYGLEVAERLGSDLAGAGVVVISGLARGIDSASHRGALAARGRTVAVLGSGLDLVYPPEHTELAAEVARSGAVVSELPPGTPPRRFHFPMRNRIISGLSLAVVVVEAAARSGALITADLALDQGREVLAVPGNILTGRFRGCHRLLKDGAALAESAHDVLEILPAGACARVQGRAADALPPEPLAARMIPGEEYDLDAICAFMAADVQVVLPRLLELELQGVVRRTDGGRFVRLRRTC